MTRIASAALFVWFYTVSPAFGAPWYCAVLSKLERSCTGVRAAVRMFGEVRATRYATACGASAQDLQGARDCLLPKPQTCPPVWKCNGKRDTNDPSCYAPACKS